MLPSISSKQGTGRRGRVIEETGTGVTSGRRGASVRGDASGGGVFCTGVVVNPQGGIQGVGTTTAGKGRPEMFVVGTLWDGSGGGREVAS